jgi:GxxExxY protein
MAFALILDIGWNLLVENEVVVELKAIKTVLPVHKAQLLSYLRLGGKRLGLLINFHVDRLKDGITRLVNGF